MHIYGLKKYVFFSFRVSVAMATRRFLLASMKRRPRLSLGKGTKKEKKSIFQIILTSHQIWPAVLEGVYQFDDLMSCCLAHSSFHECTKHFYSMVAPIHPELKVQLPPSLLIARMVGEEKKCLPTSAVHSLAALLLPLSSQRAVEMGGKGHI